jgi:hypothetical protein
VADCLTTPLRAGIFDAVLSIAVRDRGGPLHWVEEMCFFFSKFDGLSMFTTFYPYQSYHLECTIFWTNQCGASNKEKMEMYTGM